MREQSYRRARIEARLSPDVLEIVKRAAEIQGRSISDFVVTAAQEAAHKAIEENHLIRLSVEDQERFVELLLNPLPLSDALEKARFAHSQMVVESK